MNPICIISFILLSILFLAFIVGSLIKYWATIVRFFKKKQVWRFIVNVVIPFVVPFVISVLAILCDEDLKNIHLATSILLAVATINLIIQTAIWIKEKNEVDLRWENRAAGLAYNNLFEIHIDKNTQLRNSYHNGLDRGMLTDADIPYNIFNHIRKITWEFGNTIGQITGIHSKDIETAFIYRYSYENAGKKDKRWRWVSGKGSKFKPGLEDFADTADSTFHYMSHNNVSSLFYNDKQQAEKEQRYIFSYRDNSHNRTGSIVAAKVAFSGNDHSLCEGIVMVNTYGHRFLDNTKGYTEDELEKLILDSIFPCFSKMLTTELAMLYFRHQDEPKEKDETEQPQKSDRAKSFCKEWKVYNRVSKCIVAATKKVWCRK